MKRRIFGLALGIVTLFQLLAVPAFAQEGDELFITNTQLVSDMEHSSYYTYDAASDSYIPAANLVRTDHSYLKSAYSYITHTDNSVYSFSQSIARWASRTTEFIYENSDGTVNVVWVDSDNIRVDTYSSDWKLLKTKLVPLELPIYGGMYFGEKYNYIVFGQENPNEDNKLEVIRLVKYDKDFNRLDSAAVTNCYTIDPFHSGAASMAEHGDTLVLHTARLRYLTDDGKNHQSQLTVYFDTSKMTIINNLGRFQENHVSHSFNQFAKFNGSTAVLVDHGDGYPRGVVLNTSSNKGSSYSELTLLKIPGEVGANQTGVSIGDFEITDNNYMVAINTLDQSLVTGYDSYDIYGLEIQERDAVLLISPIGNTSTSKVKQVYLTDYVGSRKSAGAPYIVPLDDGRYMIMWQEFAYEDGRTSADSVGVRYVVVDEDGRAEGSAKLLPRATLGEHCEPIVYDNYVTWYVDSISTVTYDISNGPRSWITTDPATAEDRAAGKVVDEDSYRTFYQLDLRDESTKMLFTIGSTTANIFGQDVTYDAAPQIINSRTMLPARFVAEALGADVQWDQAEQKVTITREDTEIVLYVDSDTAYINGEATKLDSPAVVIGGRTYTPVRFVAEALGAKVDWFGTQSRVRIIAE